MKGCRERLVRGGGGELKWGIARGNYAKMGILIPRKTKVEPPLVPSLRTIRMKRKSFHYLFGASIASRKLNFTGRYVRVAVNRAENFAVRRTDNGFG